MLNDQLVLDDVPALGPACAAAGGACARAPPGAMAGVGAVGGAIATDDDTRVARTRCMVVSGQRAC